MLSPGAIEIPAILLSSRILFGNLSASATWMLKFCKFSVAVFEDKYKHCWIFKNKTLNVAVDPALGLNYVL